MLEPPRDRYVHRASSRIEARHTRTRLLFCLEDQVLKLGSGFHTKLPDIPVPGGCLKEVELTFPRKTVFSFWSPVP